MSKYCIIKGGPALYPECMECEDKICEFFHCLVVGSRTFNDYSFMKHKLDYFLQCQKSVVIVSGGAKGADSLAEQYAHEKGYMLKVFPAKWDLYGFYAGYARNRQMHEYISKVPKRGCVAFWQNESKGTAHNFELAKEFDTPIRIIKC